MNADARNRVVLLLLLLMAAVCQAQSARQAVRQGNELYAKKDWPGAIAAYEQATADEPGAIAPRFNKANARFKSGDFAAATDAYRQVAAESREIGVVAKAKYNLGNCFFEEGMRQKDSDLKKSIGSFEQAIQSWRGALEIDPENAKALRNIETAKLVIKNIMDEQKKQQEQQGQDPNSTQQQDQQKQGDQQQQQQGQDKQQKDPNDPNQPGQQREQQKQEEQEDEKDEKQEEQKAAEEQPQKAEDKKEAPDATAEQILRDEQDRKKNFRPGGYVPVEQDW